LIVHPLFVLAQPGSMHLSKEVLSGGCRFDSNHAGKVLPEFQFSCLEAAAPGQYDFDGLLSQTSLALPRNLHALGTLGTLEHWDLGTLGLKHSRTQGRRDLRT